MEAITKAGLLGDLIDGELLIVQQSCSDGDATISSILGRRHADGAPKASNEMRLAQMAQRGQLVISRRWAQAALDAAKSGADLARLVDPAKAGLFLLALQIRQEGRHDDMHEGSRHDKLTQPRH